MVLTISTIGAEHQHDMCGLLSRILKISTERRCGYY